MIFFFVFLGKHFSKKKDKEEVKKEEGLYPAVIRKGSVSFSSTKSHKVELTEVKKPESPGKSPL